MESTFAFTNVCYQQIKNHDSLCSSSVYSVTTGPLPTYVRTLSPKCQSTNDQSESSTDSAGTTVYSFKLRVLLLVAAFLITSSVSILVIVSIIRSGDPSELSVLTYSNKTLTHSESLLANTNHTGKQVKDEVYTFEKTPCANVCIPYRRPKFKSQCDNGYCVCEGQNYQQQSCLPVVNDCFIKKKDIDTYLDNKSVPSYTCHMTASTNIHVISVYGNHFARQTVVNLSSSGTQRATLILASHYSVRWKVKCTEVELHKVVLVSDRNVISRNIDIDCETNGTQLPAISSVRVTFGYGDDRYGTDTVRMLKVIEKTFGKMESFLGTEFADYISMKI